MRKHDESKLRIAICEDLDADRTRLMDCIRESGVPADIQTFPSGERFLETFRPGLYHLVYLDIYMAELTGIETAIAIREQDEVVLLAFVTTSPDHSLEANHFRSILYIQKPVTREMVDHTLLVATAVREKMRGQMLTVQTDYKQVDIRHTDLDYVEVLDQRCVLHLRNGGTINVSTRVNIDHLEQALPPDRFCRTGRSFIVNLDRVRKPTGTDLLMKSGDTVYVSRKEYTRVKNQFYDRKILQTRSEQTL